MGNVEIYISDNYIIKLHKDSFNITLSNKQLSIIPNNISQFIKLDTLILSRNELSDIIDELCLLTNLKRLYLNNNNFKIMPIKLKYLINLNKLDITNNNIIFIPFLSYYISYFDIDIYTIMYNNIMLFDSALELYKFHIKNLNLLSPCDKYESKSYSINIIHNNEIIKLSYWAAHDSNLIQNCIIDTENDDMPIPINISVSRKIIDIYNIICQKIYDNKNINDKFKKYQYTINTDEEHLKYIWFEFYNNLFIDGCLNELDNLNKYEIAEFYNFGFKYMDNPYIGILVKSMEWWVLRTVQIGAIGIITNYEIWRDHVRLDWADVSSDIIFRFNVTLDFMNLYNDNKKIKSNTKSIYEKLYDIKNSISNYLYNLFNNENEEQQEINEHDADEIFNNTNNYSNEKKQEINEYNADKIFKNIVDTWNIIQDNELKLGRHKNKLIYDYNNYLNNRIIKKWKE